MATGNGMGFGYVRFGYGQLGCSYMGMAGRAEHGWSAWGKQSPSWLSGLYCPSLLPWQAVTRQRAEGNQLLLAQVTACTSYCLHQLLLAEEYCLHKLLLAQVTACTIGEQ